MTGVAEGLQTVPEAPTLAPRLETPVAAPAEPFRPLQMPADALHYGNAPEPMVFVVSSGPLFRLAWPDGRVSDHCNLSRIKDAAASICERGPPARNRRRFRWVRT
jgi:hypothetical protein